MRESRGFPSPNDNGNYTKKKDADSTPTQHVPDAGDADKNRQFWSAGERRGETEAPDRQETAANEGKQGPVSSNTGNPSGQKDDHAKPKNRERNAGMKCIARMHLWCRVLVGNPGIRHSVNESAKANEHTANNQQEWPE